MLLNIVIPTHDRPGFIQKILFELSSFLANTPNVFCTIVDDNSPQDISSLVDNFGLSNIKLLCNDYNVGAPASRNRGWKSLNSKFVWFIDDDDFVDSTSLKSVYEFLLSYKDSNSIFFLERKVFRSGVLKQCYIQPPDNLKFFLKYNQQLVNTSCIIFESVLLDTISGWDESLVSGQDTDLLLRASQYSNGECINGAFVKVNQGHQSITTNPKRQIKGKYQFLFKNFKLISWLRVVKYLFTALLFIPYLKNYFKIR